MVCIDAWLVQKGDGKYCTSMFNVFFLFTFLYLLAMAFSICICFTIIKCNDPPSHLAFGSKANGSLELKEQYARIRILSLSGSLSYVRYCTFGKLSLPSKIIYKYLSYIVS